MNWQNIRLILLREVRDQLRDRRTLFMIFVLPILLYPLLGMSLLQVAQFIHEHPTSVLLVGVEELPGSPKLIDGNRFAAEWFADAKASRLLELHFQAAESASHSSTKRLPDRAATKPAAAPRRAAPAHESVASEESDGSRSTNVFERRWEQFAAEQVNQGKYQVVVAIPPGFARELAVFTDHLAGARLPTTRPATPGENPLPEILIFHNSALEKSDLCRSRVVDVLDRWRSELGRENLAAAGVDKLAPKPFDMRGQDVAPPNNRETALWSKMFPFFLLIWALTGAFYPAVDLCAGEKERGTLETLLSSPAARSDIVWGKLLTVMLFSMMTVVLNLLSIGITGHFILSKLSQVGPPPLLSLVWVLIALVPMSALFSALCMALAAFARSTKEGQYYLMPLVLITMPLVLVPMAPGVELSLGNSLIPLTGVVLLLRTMIEGNYLQALPYVPPVVAVTLVCCLFAIRWAVDQFNAEGVLFREGERLELALWVKHLRRDREDTPSIAQAALCGVLILVIRFFLSFAVQPPSNFDEFTEVALVTQLVVIVTPALLMTVMLTRSPRKTLLLAVPPWWGIPVAGLLAVGLYPVARALQSAVLKLYPISDDLAVDLNRMLAQPHSVWQLVLVVAVVPAICEELAFRGFILSGFRHLGHKWRAIVLAAIFFGLTHAIFQQTLVACLLGMVIGYVAVQTGSLLPAIVLHALHNSLSVLASGITPVTLQRYPGLSWIFEATGEAEIACRWPALALGAWLTVSLLCWLHRQPYRKTSEEQLEEAIHQHAAQGLAG